MENFDRQYRLLAGSGLLVGEGDPEALRINFRIEKTDTESPDTAKISLWNLSPQSYSGP